MRIHLQVLAAAQRICGEQGRTRFHLNEVVKALPRVSSNSVRTHVSSYCCVNAPRYHAYRHPYFKRVGFGEYELMPAFRATAREEPRRPSRPRRDTIHVVIAESDGLYVAECLEIAVVTQGRTLDEVLENRREAIALHLEDGDVDRLDVAPSPRISVTFETALV
jgi:predicted RNase H-like HicB family nuclease